MNKEYEEIIGKIKNCLKENYIIDNREKTNYDGNEPIEFLEIHDSIPNTFQKLFEIDTLQTILDFGKYPTILGYVKKEPWKQKSEVIIINLVDEQTIGNVLITRNFKDVYRAKFAFMVSQKEMPEDRINLLLTNPELFKDVIITHERIVEVPGVTISRFSQLEINSKFKSFVPSPFSQLVLREKIKPSHPTIQVSVKNILRKFNH